MEAGAPPRATPAVRVAAVPSPAGPLVGPPEPGLERPGLRRGASGARRAPERRAAAKTAKTAKAAKAAKTAKRKQPRPEPTPRTWTVVLDPGHGGRDPGARGVSGDIEKEITLAIAALVAEQLADDRQIRVVLTRIDDTYVSLEQRTAIANAEGADLFVSIHANASENPRLSGIETYTLNNTDDRATIRLAALENGLALTGAAPGESDLAYILSDLVQTGKEDESVTLARAVQTNLVSYLRERWRGVVNLGVKKGPFYVLVGAYMPCILVEVAFLTNETEGQRIAARRYQLDVAEGIARGIRRFLASETANSNL
jgi:N-acetylmuramoyl-L-alanine amidase